MNVKEILNENKFVFKKKFGQNFLLDQNILNNIVALGNITKETLVIEIGVGAAALTKKLSEKAKIVVGYEIDTTLKEPLSLILDDYNNIDIIYDDFLNRDIKSDIKEYNYKNIMVVANLPYYITTPIITKFIEEKIDVEKIIVMVQNEVADRFSAIPETKSYNSLTIFLNYYFDIKKAFTVSRNVFYPKPNVDSAVVVFERKNKKIKVKNEDMFFKLVRDAFVQKRKTIKNNLKGYNLKKIEKILNSYGKDINCRAENITINEFADISNNLD
ncbi:MAG: 16S rRNA (adenine(1518)-N(6)/adenine(1519)-N(6))-dimethyltransferase RsmA [Candidatus Aphodocola sp.]